MSQWEELLVTRSTFSSLLGQKRSGDKKPFKIQMAIGHRNIWKDSQAEKHCGIPIRLIQRPKQKNSEDLKILAYSEMVLYENIPTEEVFEVLENHLKGIYKNYLPKALSSNRQLCVCTHGRYDQCCAKFGYQLFDTLRESISDTDPSIEIWESSHIGGHRFAPTMLDMPSGKMYGRVETSLINALLYEGLSIEFHRGNVSPILATSCRTRNQKISDRSTVEW